MRAMAPWLIVALAALSVLAPAAPKGRTVELDRVLQEGVDQKLVPYVLAVVATPDGVVYEHAIGVKKDAIFAIASMTKPVTSVAIMQLVEAGKIRLDEPAATYAPELAGVQVLEGGSLRPPRSAVTIRQLLTHTSGFAYEFMNRSLRDYVAAGKAPSMMAGDGWFLKGAPLMFDPGTQWEYGIGTDWLGSIVEKLSGMSLERYFRSRIFDPLKMPDSFFDVPPGKQARLAAVFQRKPDGTLAELPRQPVAPKKFFSGGGGLYSTAADYIRFARALLAGGSPVLKPESVGLMGRNQIGELSLRPLSSVMPQFAKDQAVIPGGLDKFGLGFALNSGTAGGGRGPNSMAWAGIYNTFFWIDREKKVCAVLMTQMLPGMDDGPAKLLADFERAVYEWKR
jgi:CubicO group peptidase (beta-lactamase class C family)